MLQVYLRTKMSLLSATQNNMLVNKLTGSGALSSINFAFPN